MLDILAHKRRRKRCGHSDATTDDIRMKMNTGEKNLNTHFLKNVFILVLLIKTNQTVQGQKRWLLCKHCVYIHEWGFWGDIYSLQTQQQQQTVHT